MPNTADRDIETIPNLHDLDTGEIPFSVLKSLVGRLQEADQGGYSVSAFENYVGGARAELPDAA
jgi:hypothetical protein